MRELTFGVEITGTWGQWEARVRDLSDVRVRGKEAECMAVSEAERQIAAAVSYYLAHKMPLPAPSPIRSHEWRFTVAIDGCKAVVSEVE